MQKNQLTQLVKGTRDVYAAQAMQRNYIIDHIKAVYQSYGFMPLETPALEQVSTLLGKYGADGEQLIYRILNSGDFLTGIDASAITDYKTLLPHIAEKGLRYDLTVPLMRYIATHHHELVFPFKRYQIQPVWRADRPQKGRYREFYQCDADVIGTSSLWIEAELLVMVHEVLTKLGITDFKLSLNNRAILNSIVTLMGAAERVNEFCIIIDKLDKIGKDRVMQELINQGFDWTALEKFAFIFDMQGDNAAKLQILRTQLQQSESGLQAIANVAEILHLLNKLGISNNHITIEPSLARGLSYYTGIIFEVTIPNVSIGSIVGGGRYTNFGEAFGLTHMTGVGLSFGVDRLCVAMESLGVFPDSIGVATTVLFTHQSQEVVDIVLHVIPQLRQNGVAVELYPDPVSLKKQLSYANKKLIPFLVIIEEEALKNKKYILRDMNKGTQNLHTSQELINLLRCL